VVAQEVEEKISLASTRSEMDIGDEEGAKMPRTIFNHDSHLFSDYRTSELYVSRVATA